MSRKNKKCTRSRAGSGFYLISCSASSFGKVIGDRVKGGNTVVCTDLDYKNREVLDKLFYWCVNSKHYGSIVTKDA